MACACCKKKSGSGSGSGRGGSGSGSGSGGSGGIPRVPNYICCPSGILSTLPGLLYFNIVFAKIAPFGLPICEANIMGSYPCIYDPITEKWGYDGPMAGGVGSLFIKFKLICNATQSPCSAGVPGIRAQLTDTFKMGACISRTGVSSGDFSDNCTPCDSSPINLYHNETGSAGSEWFTSTISEGTCCRTTDITANSVAINWSITE